MLYTVKSKAACSSPLGTVRQMKNNNALSGHNGHVLMFRAASDVVLSSTPLFLHSFNHPGGFPNGFEP